MDIFDIKIPDYSNPKPITSKLRDLFISQDAIDAMRQWGIDELSDQTRREIYGYGEGSSLDVQPFRKH